MTNAQQGRDNTENMEKVRALMNTAKEVNLGGELRNIVPIDYTSQFGTKFTGKIEFKRPTMQDYMKMGALKAQYLGAYGVVDMRIVDGTIKFMAQVMSTLKVVVVKAPAWLVGAGGTIDVENVQEPDVLYHIYDLYEQWELSFRKSVQDDVQADSQATE